MESISILDESFPEDDLFSIAGEENLDNNLDTNKSVTVDVDTNLSSPFELGSLSINEHDYEPSSGQFSTESSGLSSQDKHCDESKETLTSTNTNSSHNILQSSSKLTYNAKKFTYSQSYQDLHSEYTKKKYQHVKSKVQEYIANIRAQDRRRREKKKMERHSSLLDTISSHKKSKDFLGTADDLRCQLVSKPNKFNGKTAEYNVRDIENKHGDGDEISKILLQKDEQINELKRLNEYLQTNINDKMALAARYKRNADTMQVDLMNLKEHERRYKQNALKMGYRNCFSSSYDLFKGYRAAVSTQTDFHQVNNKSVGIEVQTDLDLINTNSNIHRNTLISRNTFPLLYSYELNNKGTSSNETIDVAKINNYSERERNDDEGTYLNFSNTLGVLNIGNSSSIAGCSCILNNNNSTLNTRIMNNNDTNSKILLSPRKAIEQENHMVSKSCTPPTIVKSLRRRSNSSSVNLGKNHHSKETSPCIQLSENTINNNHELFLYDGSDSAIDTNEFMHFNGLNSSSNDMNVQFLNSNKLSVKNDSTILEQQQQQQQQKCLLNIIIKQKKKKVKTRNLSNKYWQLLFGSCFRCCNKENVKYQEIPLSESMYMNL